MLIINDHIKIPLEEFELTFARSSGPGGQNVNKVNSKAVLRWNVQSTPSLPVAVRERFLLKYAARLTNDGDLLLTSQEYRDAPRNSQNCLDRLRALVLAVATPPKRRRATRPTRGSVERRLQAKRRQSGVKQRRSVRDED